MEEGLVSQFLKPKFLINERIHNINFLNVIRVTLNPENEMQALSISMIDQKTNLMFSNLKLSINTGVITENELMGVREDLIRLIAHIEEGWEETSSKEDISAVLEFKAYLNPTSN
ncbi:hypothetical protein [Pseudoalteromonas rubra]|nr:hypothetical protein [Pseudoalteromonas rubra]